MRLSIVLTTYNRKSLVVEAIDSALPWLNSPVNTEIVVVDDASTDGTIAHLQSRYFELIANKRLHLVALERNRGCTGAKNIGVSIANGDWIVILDSDDVLLLNSQRAVASAIEAHNKYAWLCFRCLRLENGELMGVRVNGPTEVSERYFLRWWRFSECMPAVRRKVLLEIPFDEDLRGFEGFTMIKVIRRYGPLLVLKEPTLRCRVSNDDRQTKATLSKRACLMARGHARMLRYAPWEYGLRAGLLTIAKIVLYAVCCSLDKLRRGSSPAGTGMPSH